MSESKSTETELGALSRARSTIEHIFKAFRAEQIYSNRAKQNRTLQYSYAPQRISRHGVEINKQDGKSEPIFDIIKRVGDEATKVILKKLASVKTPKAEKRVGSDRFRDSDGFNTDPNDEEMRAICDICSC